MCGVFLTIVLSLILYSDRENIFDLLLSSHVGEYEVSFIQEVTSWVES